MFESTHPAAAANEAIRAFLLARVGRTLSPAEWAEYERLRAAYMRAVRGETTTTA